MDAKYKGLSPDQVFNSRKVHGENILTPPPRDPWWKLLVEKFNDPIIRILSIAAFIAIVLGIFNGHYLEGIGIVVAIFLATFMSFVNEYRAGKEFDILNRVNDDMPVKVVREGNVTSIPKREVVVGDIVIIDRGDEIPCDGVLLEAVSLSVNESSLTGEPHTHKSTNLDDDERSTYAVNLVFKSTIVIEGHGIVEATAVGDKTEIGTTARESTISIGTPTPLTLQLHRLSDFISAAAFLLSIIIFSILAMVDIVQGNFGMDFSQEYIFGSVVLTIVVLLSKFWLPSINFLIKSVGLSWQVPDIFQKIKVNAMLVSVALGVLFWVGAGILGMLMGVNFFDSGSWFSMEELRSLLIYFMVSMTVIVVAVPEGLAMSVTLSLAYSMRKMTAANNLVRKMQATETMGATTVICTDKTGTLTQNQMKVLEWRFIDLSDIHNNSVDAELVKYSMSVNSTAHLDFSETTIKTVGNPTDAALLLWLNGENIDYKAERADFKIEYQHPFSSEKKYMFTVGYSTRLNRRYLLAKGAPEVILSMSDFDENTTNLSKKIIAQYQEQSLRAIGFAYRELKDETYDEGQIPLGLKFLGFVGIADPVRDDVAFAVKSCHSAGIDVKMVTGDNIVTASAIGKQIDLLSGGQDGQVISGPEFELLDDNEASKLVSNLKIMYRARPADKLKLVRLLQEKGNVVAVTGDGTNDAPSLNRANVGLAMGSGTQVAKEASDIILLDDSFSSIVNAVKWGRTLYHNIQKFLFFQLTINLLAVAIVLIGPFTGITLPLTVTQMLWVNLIMDTFAALALATEPPHSGIMSEPPRNPKEFIITKPIRQGILVTASIFFLILVTLLYILKFDGIVSNYELTIFFNVFVMLQFWNLFNARVFGENVTAFHRLIHNKGFLLIALFIIIGQIFIVQYGGELFRTVPLRLIDWLIIIFSTSFILWFSEIFKFIHRKIA